MGYAAEKQIVEYNTIPSSELSHYMTVDEMHERLTATIRSHYAQKA